jgi:hypothetical protein
MGVQGAQPPFSAISGPGRHALFAMFLCCCNPRLREEVKNDTFNAVGWAQMSNDLANKAGNAGEWAAANPDQVKAVREHPAPPAPTARVAAIDARLTPAGRAQGAQFAYNNREAAQQGAQFAMNNPGAARAIAGAAGASTAI